MRKYLYECPLGGMKYNILTAPNQDSTVREIAEIYGFSLQLLRKALIEKCDMILLENLSARYQEWKTQTPDESPEKLLGTSLFSRIIPLISREEADRIIDETTTGIYMGMPHEETIKKGKERMREAVLR